MTHRNIPEAPLSRFIFSDTRTAAVWLLVRLYVGWTWFTAGWAKVSSASWVGEDAGASLSGFIRGALAKTGSEHPDVQSWYASFLQDVVLPNVEVWSVAVAYGELLVGAALVLGLFTGIAAFFGLFMNLNFMLSGAVSTNPILFTLSVGLILAWRVAGHLGFDRYVLPMLGVPWQPGTLFNRRK